MTQQQTSLAGPCHISNSLQGKHSVAALTAKFSFGAGGAGHEMAQPGVGKRSRARWNSYELMMRDKDVF